MDKLVVALGPALAAGFAIQRLLEIVDPLVDKLYGEYKKLILGLVSLVVGLALAFGLGLRVLQPLGVTSTGLLDGFATALIISAGTEGFNSIMKFLGYAKEEKKASAAEEGSRVGADALKKLKKAI